MCNLCKWECKMFYKDKLYTGYYWGNDYSLARARKKVTELQQVNPAMRFELADNQNGIKIIFKELI
jgi:hypothetical protein